MFILFVVLNVVGAAGGSGLNAQSIVSVAEKAE
jgi:hypothetical protein